MTWIETLDDGNLILRSPRKSFHDIDVGLQVTIMCVFILWKLFKKRDHSFIHWLSKYILQARGYWVGVLITTDRFMCPKSKQSLLRLYYMSLIFISDRYRNNIRLWLLNILSICTTFCYVNCYRNYIWGQYGVLYPVRWSISNTVCSDR